MHIFTFAREKSLPKIVLGSILILLLILQYSFAVTHVFAQETDSITNTTTVEVSAEVEAELEEELTTSAEVAKELSVDLKAELGIPEDYDPVVPDSFFNQIGYGFKSFGRNVQEIGYGVFASESAHAELLKDHANEQLVEAVKLYSSNPTEYGGRAVGILDNYKDDLVNVQERIAAVKEENPELAKSLAAEIAEDHMFVAPKILGSVEETMLTNAPQEVPKLIALKDDVLGAAGITVVGASDNDTEVAETLKIIAEKTDKTPFSGLASAEVLTKTKRHLGEASLGIQAAFDNAINQSLSRVEENLNKLTVSDEVKGNSIEKFVNQLPGQSLERMRIVDQFKNRPNLPPVMIEKMQKVKAKLAETIGDRIQRVVQEEIRRAVSDAMLEFDDPNVEDLKILGEFGDLVAHEDLREVVTQNHEKEVAKFLTKFGDDKNAVKVTDEFQTLMRKVESGQITPDANFFKTLDKLKGKLNPEQQRFIDQAEDTGREEMFDRMQNDPNFVERFSTFNPADIEVFDRVQQGFGRDLGPPPEFDFASKFKEIERKQADNFRQYLEFQNNPTQVQNIRNNFERNVSSQVRQRFETQQSFNFEAEFSRNEAQARQKEAFFQQKFEQAQREYDEQFGSQGQQPGPRPGFGPQPFPGQPFPGQGPFFPGFQPPSGIPTDNTGGPTTQSTKACGPGQHQGPYGCEFDFDAPETNFDPAARCVKSGGTWSGSFCKFPQFNPINPVENPDGTQSQPPTADPATQCARTGGTWLGYCDYSTVEPFPVPSSPRVGSQAECEAAGGTWAASQLYCDYSSTYPTPSNTPDPATACGTSGGTWTNGYCDYSSATPPTATETPENCVSAGGTWQGTYCNYGNSNTADPAYACGQSGGVYSNNYCDYSNDPGSACGTAGGVWTNGYCDMSNAPGTSTYPTPYDSDPAVGCAQAGGAWSNGYCDMSNAPGTSTYPTPSDSTYTPPGPTYSDPVPDGSYPTPSDSSYPTPNSYPTPSYPTPDSGSYPTPSYATPAETYPTPDSGSYPTPSYVTPAETYPTPAEAYPTPSYNTPPSEPPPPPPDGSVQGRTYYRSYNPFAPIINLLNFHPLIY
jgi:hypothetical protein